MLSPSAGRRPGVPGTVVILADGPSSDDAIGPARAIKAAGEMKFLGVCHKKVEDRLFTLVFVLTVDCIILIG